MAQVFTVTASTSIVLVDSVGNPYTVVLLSSIKTPGHIVGIRDTTGYPGLPSQPIVVSTTKGLSFYDGTFSTLITTPLGSLTVSSKDATTWQLLNNQGFPTSLSNAYLSNLTVQNSYIQTISTQQEYVSSSVIGRINVTNSIELGGTTQILGDITVGGNVDFFSTLDVFGKLSLSSITTVAGNFVSLSSVQILGNLDVRGFMSTPNDLVVGQGVFVDQNVFARSALVPRNLSVQTLAFIRLTIGGGLQSAYTLSTQSNAIIAQDLVVLGSTVLQSSLRVGQSTLIEGGLFGASSFQTLSLSTLGYFSVGKDVNVQGYVVGEGTASSFYTFAVASTLGIDGMLVAKDNVFVDGKSQFVDLTVLGSVRLSSIHATSSVSITGDALSYGSTFQTLKDFRIGGNLGVGGSFLGETASATVSTGVSSFGALGVGGSLIVEWDLSSRGNLTVGGDTINVSSLSVQESISTTALEATGILFVENDLKVGVLLGASTLGAPIQLEISSLSLSNTFFIQSKGTVPRLDLNGYPSKIVVGPNPVDTGDEITVDGILQNRSTIFQPEYGTYTKLWTATALNASTLTIPLPLSTTYIGALTNTKPLLTNYGSVFTGSFSTIPGATSNLFLSSNISTNYATANNRFGSDFGGSKVATNGSNRWVAVGTGTTAAGSILVSANGYNWTQAATGGFLQGGRSVAFGSSRWIAVGVPFGPNTSIQASSDGLNWANTVNAFTGVGNDVAYNGSNLWVAVGSQAGIAGIKYSGNGLQWSNATLIPPVPFTGVGIAFGNGRWVACDGANTLATSTDGVSWLWIPGQPFAKSRIAYNGTQWAAGGPATGANPLTSIQLSADGLTWIPITTGGFTDRCNDIVWDAQLSLWLAAGGTQPITSNVLQSSADGLNWSPIPFSQLGMGRGIATGIIQAPDMANYLTFNLPTLFHSSLSSSVLYASTIRASSITSQGFLGDGALLSNVTSFRGDIYTSSFIAGKGYTLDISAQRLQTEFMRVSKDITILQNSFLSTVNLWVAAGADSETTGNIQTSFTGSTWRRGIGPTFEFYAKSIVGNCNIANPVFVATGADSRTDYTIQWSLDARTWNPITTGGFSIATGDGIKQGNSVAYSSNLNLWVAGGNSAGSDESILYSSDLQNWSVAMGGFMDETLVVAAAPTGFVALGSSGVKYSGTGTQWSNSATSVVLDAVGYGSVQDGPLTYTGWLGVSNTSMYVSSNAGQTWVPTGFNSLKNIVSLVYGGSLWVGVGCNLIQYSSNGQTWNGVATSFTPDTLFNAIAYNSNQARWVAGALSTTADKSLWSSSNLQDWFPAASGGFSTSVLTSGAGYGIFTSSLYTYAVGQGSFNGVTPTQQMILSVSTSGGGSYLTSNSLSQSNASNVFESQVRGIGGSVEPLYSYVAVGDGLVPQKTIARSQTGEAGSWLPAITGGFSTVGYGVVYAGGKWIAVGDAQASTNTIQYSPDGANWFGTNTAQGIRLGGRGIGVGTGSNFSTLIAVGKDITTSTILKSLDGFNWLNTTGSYFMGQGNSVIGGSNEFGLENYVAVGSDSRGALSTILRSQDGTTWSNITTGGFSGGGFGIAFGTLGVGSNYFVAVGVDANQSNTIQFSSNGGANFLPATSGSFTQAGYAVGFNPLSNLFFAVGEDLGALRSATIKYSGDATNWSNVSSLAGFQSQTTLGAGYGVFTQGILVSEIIPYLQFPNLAIYERTEPLGYPTATIRLQSSFMTFNESLYMNLSSQVILSSNVPYSPSTILTVYGTIYASSFVYTGNTVPNETMRVSSLIVSTLSSYQTLKAISLTTPSLAFNTAESKANLISTSVETVPDYTTNTTIQTNVLGLNNVLFTTANVPYQQRVGIGISSPNYELDIKGSFGVSTFSTTYFLGVRQLDFERLQGSFAGDGLFSMAVGDDTDIIPVSNTILATPSSLVLNGVVSINLSTQKVGFYTQNPQFKLDVRSHATLQVLSAPTVRTSLLFLTLQSE